MTEPAGGGQGHRPEACPYCGSKAVGTLAKVITPATHWRCQSCGEGWTLATLPPSSRRPRRDLA